MSKNIKKTLNISITPVFMHIFVNIWFDQALIMIIIFRLN